jgi:protoheme IX farnesyltransferase
MRVLSRVYAYLEVTKPRESVLLAFIGVCAAVIAAGGLIPVGRFWFITGAILIASAGANGLTNYLDRDLDARMPRTQHRALASRRIDPPYKVLPLLIVLVVGGLILAWQLHPYAFIADVVGTVAAVVWRKRWTCVFPQGMIASCAPVLMGWFAVSPVFSWPMLWLCVLISIWLPIHLWSVMVTHREDYIRAGITFFPMSRPAASVVRLLVVLSLALYFSSLAFYFIADFHWLYLVFANLLGAAVIFTSLRLLFGGTRRTSWRLYRLSAFPYLGLLFLAMILDVVLL